MNKSDLIELVAENSNLNLKEAGEVVNTIFDTMTKALVDGRRIEIRGFGSFVNKEYGAYTGRNPKTGEEINVSAKRLPFFKVGKELRIRANDGVDPGDYTETMTFSTATETTTIHTSDESKNS